MCICHPSLRYGERRLAFVCNRFKFSYENFVLLLKHNIIESLLYMLKFYFAIKTLLTKLQVFQLNSHLEDL